MHEQAISWYHRPITPTQSVARSDSDPPKIIVAGPLKSMNELLSTYDTAIFHYYHNWFGRILVTVDILL